MKNEQLAPGLARVEPGLLQRDADLVANAVWVARDVDSGDDARPEVIVSSVVSIRTVVDLPAPFGPRKPKTSPVLDLEIDTANGLDGVVATSIRLH